MASDVAITEGRCLCGTVRYSIAGPLGEVRYCHCRMCRRATGTAFSANARVPRGRFALLAGAAAIREYEASPGAFRCFCGDCGSPVFARVESDPDHIRIRLGGLDDPQGIDVTAHVWTESKAGWFGICDALPRHERGYTPS